MLHRHAGGHPVVGENCRGRTVRNQRPAFAHELRQLRQPLNSHAAANIVARIVDAQIRRQVRFPVRNRIVAGLRNPVHDGLRRPAHVRENDHVVLRAQIAVAQLLIGEIRVRDAVVIQRRPHPAFILRTLPGVHVADARNVQLMRFHCRRRADRPRGKAQIPNHRFQLRAIGIRNR